MTGKIHTSVIKKIHLSLSCMIMFFGVFTVILGGLFTSNASGNTPYICLNNTVDEANCKDCCDGLENPLERKACRDACIAKSATDAGFSTNSDFITVDSESILGADYPYLEAIGLGSEAACKDYCDESSMLASGDRKFCRDACNATFASAGTPPEPNDPNNTDDSAISITQALSDQAQMTTIAFDGLAFLTGDLCSDTFFPPGKVSDFFGFQYRRDITPNGFGHNTEFAGKVADYVLGILTTAQVQALVTLANTQADLVDSYAYKRFVLIKAFRRLLDNDLPDGATGLDKSAVMEFSADLYEIDGEISYARATVVGGILASLTDTQKAALVQLETDLNALFEQAGNGGSIGVNDWPTPASQANLSGLNSTIRVLVSTYADDLFSWYLGSVDGDTYFCPERHGTYFGSFYMKDIPPISATEAVTIDSNLTAEMGQSFLDALNDTQKGLITNLVEIQRTALNNIVSKRAEIAQKLRLFMSGSTVSKDEVIALVRQYGEYDGEIVYNYATSFSTVGHSLTSAQATTLMGLRTDYYSEFPDYQADSSVYDCVGAWLYSSRLDVMPQIQDTDFLFGVSSGLVEEGAALTLILGGFSFAEGPACDSEGNLYFTDILSNIIYKWSEELGMTVFRSNSGGANGLYVDSEGQLIVCEGGNQRLVSINPSDPSDVTVIAGEYGGQPFNEPNDLWVAPNGGVYFTDPVYFASETPQGGEYVYYLSPDKESTIRVIEDMTRPNGLVGTPDGNTLYVTDHGAGKTYRYTINSDGTLSDKQLFAAMGGDGMTLDSEGNVYLCCTDGVRIYDASGNLVETIAVPDQPTNVCFGGETGKTLFITTHSSVYSLSMNVGGVGASESSDLSVDSIIDTIEEKIKDAKASCFIESLNI